VAKRKKKKKEQKEEKKKSFSLPTEVKKAIWVVVFFACSIIFFLSLIGQAGRAGIYLNKGLRVMFGWGVWALPFILMLLPFFLIGRDKNKAYPAVKITGTGIFVLVYSSLLNLRLPQEQIFTYLRHGQGGGYVGLVFSYPLLKLAGFWTSLIILVALGTITLLLMFETKLFKIGRSIVWLGQRSRTGFLAGRLKEKLTRQIKGEPEFIENFGEAGEPPALAGQGNQKGLVLKKTWPNSIDKEEPATRFGQREVEQTNKESQEFSASLRSRFRRRIDIPLSLLNKRSGMPSSGDINANKKKIQKALENFGVEVEMGKTSTGPTVTQYTLKPQEGVKLSQIISLSNDLALALAAHPVRIEAPIPGKSLVGIEVPNSVIATVGLREVLQSKKFRKERKSNLTLALGKDVSGAVYVTNLGSMPHLLIAGATGSGKSVCINSIIISLLYQNSPDELKFILVDPKRVELSIYNGVPHLLTPVITNAKKTINALKWAVEEMDRRYDILAQASRRNIEDYNRSATDCLPYIVIIIDELADLMSLSAKEVEALIVRLAQMARAVGIHLILATQRPSVNVLTGLIKANITARIVFAVASQTDSRTILDSGGAEKMLGRGDMLFINAEMSKPKRLQGAFVSDKERKRVVKFLQEKSEPDYLQEVTEQKRSFSIPGASVVDENGDELLDEARELIIKAGKASASYLQRHLRIGYARAARILDLLEAEGVIGPVDGAKPRELLIGRGDSEEEESVST
jgi:S-DNA-T family DNA segregation ATPase FtsK/SpoIIIE